MSRTPYPCLLLLGLAPMALLAAQPVSDPWAAARSFDFTTAAHGLAALHEVAPGDARVAVAHAAGLLARQPRTAGNIAEARRVLERVVAAPAVTGGGEARVLAAYLLARIDHEHLDTPRHVEAWAGYEALRAAHPGHALSDHAAVHLGFLLVEPGETAVAEPIAPLEALLEGVRLPAARRELHLLLGHVLVRRLDRPAEALPHYLEARRIGSDMPGRNPDLDLVIATLAARIGDDALAAARYRAFIEARPRDTRAHTVSRLAAEAAARIQP